MGSYDELIGDTLAMVNVVRQSFGVSPLSELPDAKPGDASDCLFFRAFGDLGVTGVTGATMSFGSERVASMVGTLWGTNYNGGSVQVPHQFAEVISHFDNHEYEHYQTSSNDPF